MNGRGTSGVPILKQGRYLIATILSALPDDDFLQLCDDLLDKVGKSRSFGVVVDVSGLDVIDSFASHTLSRMVQMVQLRGAKAVIAGIQPQVALTMVQQGLSLGYAATVLDLEEGLSYLDILTGQGRSALPRGSVALNGLVRQR